MITRAFQGPFARSPSESRYPQLWNGLVFGGCPSLGPTGSILRDRSRQNHATLNAFTLTNAWMPSVGQYELRLDGVDDYVSIPAITGLTAVCSISIWFRPTAFSSGMNKYLMDMGVNNHQIQVIDENNSGTPSIAFDSTIPAGRSELLTPNAWYHLVCLAAGSVVSVYVNGVFDWSDAKVSATPGDIVVGRFGGVTPADRWFDGGVDDLRIYNRVLTSPEIYLLYSAGRGGAYRMRERRRARSAAGGMLLQRRRMCA